MYPGTIPLENSVDKDQDWDGPLLFEFLTDFSKEWKPSEKVEPAPAARIRNPLLSRH